MLVIFKYVVIIFWAYGNGKNDTHTGHKFKRSDQMCCTNTELPNHDIWINKKLVSFPVSGNSETFIIDNFTIFLFF